MFKSRFARLAEVLLLVLYFGVTANAMEKSELLANQRERLLLDFNWRFHLGDSCEKRRDFNFGTPHMFGLATMNLLKVVQDDFNDSNWQQINLPHDWVVELPFDSTADKGHGFKPTGREFPQNNIGWYRKVFDISNEDLGKRISIEFDGVFRDSYVWLNGFLLGRNMNGYNYFNYDVSDCINYGGKNVLAVRVDATFQNGWWYEGGGIYRHVWLAKTNPIHVARNGTFVVSQVSEGDGLITAETKIANEADEAAFVELESSIENSDGKTIDRNVISKIMIKPWDQTKLSCKMNITNATLWSPESPILYKLVSIVKKDDGSVLDRYETVFGVRTISYDHEKGFFLNGKNIFLKGTCNHQDHAGVGTALPDRLQYYRIELLKEMGSNAIRTSHNTSAPEFLEACDRLGILVMEENRTMGSNPEILGNVQDLVSRDRNHPCIVMWSLGNEEEAIEGNVYGERIAKTMMRKIRELDPTRPITMAMNKFWGTGISNVVDIQGINYHHKDVDIFRQTFPNKPVIMSEDGSAHSTRGIYEIDPNKGYMSAYGDTHSGSGSTAIENLQFYSKRPWLIGTFVWTGLDYRGEPTPSQWPAINSHFGIMDTCGFPKDDFFFYQAWWGDKTVLHLLPHWNWVGKEGQEIDVRCFTNCEEVELFLNGESLGKKIVTDVNDVRWKVKYEPGALAVKGYKNGKQIAQTSVETTGEPASVTLSADRTTINADGEDISIVRVEIRDDKGKLCPTAENLVKFTVIGSGKIIGVGNGNPASHEPDKASQRKAFSGLCQVIVQGTKTPGDIKLTAQSDGLAGTDITIKAQKCPLRPAVP